MDQNYTQKEEEINLREVIKPYLQHWKYFVLGVLIALVLAFLYLRQATSVYDVSSSVVIKDAKNTSSSASDLGILGDLSSLNGMGTNSVDNEVEIFKSKRLMTKVVKENNLQFRIFDKEGWHDNELFGESSPVLIKVVQEKEIPSDKMPNHPLELKLLRGGQLSIDSEDLPKEILGSLNHLISLPYANIIITSNPLYKPKNKYNSLEISYTPLEDRVDNILNGLKVDLVNQDATVIGISIKSAQVDQAKKIINDLVIAYNDDAIADKDFVARKTLEFVNDRLAIISKELGDVEAQKEQFKQKNDLTDIPTEVQIGLKSNADAQSKLLDTETQLNINNALIASVEKEGTFELIPVNIGLSDVAAAQNINTYNQMVLTRNRLLQNATNEHPAVVEVTKQIKNMRANILSNLFKSRRGLQIASQNLQGQLNKENNQLEKVPALERQFRNIDRNQTLKENLYLTLLQKREETSINLQVTAPKAKVVDYASKSQNPVSPKRNIVYLGAFLLGLLVPFGLIYSKELLNNKIKTKHDLSDLVESPVLGELPRIGRGEQNIVEVNDLSPLAEAFRIVITNLNFLLSKKKDGQVIIVTSSVKGEGKTFTSANLALTMATPLKKVVIVGADIRNPQLHNFGPSRVNKEGLVDYLHSDNVSVDSVLKPSAINKHLTVIGTGQMPPNPTELLTNGRFEELLEELKPRFDYIIVDTAPLMLVTDTFLISSLADATIYVTRSETTEKKTMEFAKDCINSKKIKNVGFVLNDVSKNNFGYGNKYGYGYGKSSDDSWYDRLMGRFGTDR